MTTAPISPITYSDITAGGELAQRALKNFARLEDAYYHPSALWKGNEGWAGDLEGRAVLAWVMLAQATHREARYLEETLQEFPARMNADERASGASQWANLHGDRAARLPQHLRAAGRG